MNEFLFSKDKWVCPNDRQLALRAKLQSGWSWHSEHTAAAAPTNSDKACQLSASEQEKINRVLARAERVSNMEQERIGRLVDRVEHMRRNALGNGDSQCVLCGEMFGKVIGASAQICGDCKKAVCIKCGIDSNTVKGSPIWLCKICSEQRELWKRAGAWFFKALPKYGTSSTSATRDSRGGSKDSLMSDKYYLSKHHHSPRSSLSPSEHTLANHINNNPTAMVTSSSSSSSSAATTTTAAMEQHRNSPLRQYAWSVNRIKVSNGSSSDDSDSDVMGGGASVVASSSRQESLESKDSAGSSSRLPPTAGELSHHHHHPQHYLHHHSNQHHDVGDDRRGSSSSGIGPPGSRNSPEGQSSDNMIYDQRTSSSPDHENDGDDDDDDDVDDSGNLGTIEFSLIFEPSEHALKCNILKAKNLKSMNYNGLSDPYVKLHILPGANKSSKIRSKTICRTVNPEWREELVYHGITQADILSKTLRLTVLDEDKFVHDFLGETRVLLRRLNPRDVKNFNVFLEKQVPLEHGDELIHQDRGKLLLSLRYQSSTEALVVGIIRCANLAAMDANGFSDPYVKVYLKPDAFKKSKNKTAVKKRTLNPQFNEEFYYECKLGDLSKKTLLIKVWDQDFCRSNDYIGGVYLGLTSKGDRLKHWTDCLRNPDYRIDMWHTLSLEKVDDGSST